MREERGTIAGDYVVSEPLTLWGSIGGNVRVVEGGKFYLRGAIYGDLVCEYGGRMHIFGRVTGSLTVKRGAKVIHSGVLGGDAINDGGRLFIESTAMTNGKIKTLRGETKISHLYAGEAPTES
jgi:cytoskeletal protein CcmA (bactofilin family)